MERVNAADRPPRVKISERIVIGDDQPSFRASERSELREYLAMLSGVDTISEHEIRENPSVPNGDGQLVFNLINEIVVTCGSTGGLIFILKLAMDVLSQWVAGRSERSIRIRDGEYEIEVHGSNDFEEAIRHLEILEKRRITNDSPATEITRDDVDQASGSSTF